MPKGDASRLEDESGMTLVEVLVAVTVLAVAVLALASTAIASVHSLRASRDRQDATQIATSTVEDLRALPYGEVALSPSDPDWATAPDVTEPTPGTYVYDGDVAAEELVVEPSGQVDHLASDGDFQIRTYVTWEDRAIGLKRLTTVVTGRGRPVGHSTLVAEANRGLPAPAFTVGPTDTTLFLPLGQTACSGHTLANLGESDRYELYMPTVDPAPGDGRVQQATAHSTHLDTPGGWRIESDLDGIDMVAVPASNLYPDSSEVERRTAASLELCVTAPGTAAVGTTETFLITLRSAFDPTVTVDVELTVEIRPAVLDLWLHSSGVAANDTSRYYVMDQVSPTTAGTPGDLDGDGVLGVRLVDGATATTAVGKWDYQWTSPATLPGDATLSLWTSWAGAIQALDPTATGLTINVRIDRLNTDGSLAESGPVSTLSYVHAQGGWVQQTVTLDGPLTYATNQYLRVRAWCDTASEVDCHVAFDRDPEHPARLVVAR